MRQAAPASPVTTRGLELVSVAVVLFMGAVLRLWQIDDVPPGVFFDEAVNAYEATQLWIQGPRVFYQANQGREPMYVYLLAVATQLFGALPIALRYTSAAVGLLTIPAMYIAVRRLFGFRISLIASFLIATSFWHLSLSRMGFRTILLPLFATLALYFVLRALQRASRRDAVIAGLLLGMIPYTYTAGRATILFLALVALSLALVPSWRPSLSPRVAVGLTGTICAVAIIVTLPIALYFSRNPDDFIGRAQNVSMASSAEGGDLAAIANNALATAGGLVWWGDENSRHNLPGRPVFDPAASVLLVVGVGLALIRMRRFGYALVIAWVVVGLVPGVVTIDSPHFLRVAGLIPMVYVLPALAVDRALTLAYAVPPSAALRLAGWSLVGLLGIGQLVGVVVDFFWLWPVRTDVLDSYQADYRMVPLASRDVPDGALAMVSTDFVSARGPAPAFLYPLLEQRVRYFNGRNCLPEAPQGEPESHFILPHSSVGRGPQIHNIMGKNERPIVYLDSGGRPAVHVIRNDPDAFDQEFRRGRELGVSFDPWFVVHGYQLRRQVSPGEELLLSLSMELKQELPRTDGWKLRARLVSNESQEVRSEASADLCFRSGESVPGDRTIMGVRVPVPSHINPGLHTLVVDLANGGSVSGYAGKPTARDSDGQPLPDGIFLGPLRVSEPPGPTAPPTVWLNYRLGPDIGLEGFTLTPANPRPGDLIDLTLFWSTSNYVDKSYTVFVQLLDGDDQIVAQRDVRPADSEQPTDAWEPGLRVRDHHKLVVPEDTAGQRLRLIVGMYYFPDGSRLQVYLPTGGWMGDFVEIATVSP